MNLAPPNSKLKTQDSKPPFDNRSLFSDHYLAERLPDHPEWMEDVTTVWEAARTLWAEKRPILDGLNEAQTEEEWVKPLLTRVLGWAYDVQATATFAGRINRPDYALFTTDEAKLAAQKQRADEAAYYTHAAAVGDAKFWNRPLDQKLDDTRDRLTNANPSFQIVNYLVASGVPWGLLTNGREWRLYSTRARSRIDTYYAVDLQRILEEGDEGDFRRFLLFFRAAAFRPDPRTGRSFLDAVLAGSAEYGAELEKRLKRLIFEEVFPTLAKGFVEWRRREMGVSDETEESLAEIYGGTLRLLYRLLFLLHAESRGLLPVTQLDGYGRYSLMRIKRDVAERLDGGTTLSSVSTDLWNDLDGLFRIIDHGDAALDVPRYNGGLFRADHPKNEFFREHRLADRFLYPALDRLTRAGERSFIDYKSLNVEQLGSIYEGLLEFHLRMGPEGEVFLENDRGERKATGSYYTPHYIVEFIVARTIGPALAEREARFRERMAEIGPKRDRLREIREKLDADPARADAAASRWRNERRELKDALKPLEADATDALLGIRICDPAMGSGHFLVHATDWLTERLMVTLNEHSENPVLERIAEIRAQIIDNLAEQGITVDPEQLKDTHLLKRMVMKRCIYGVDLNPMATELAKLSLWLDSFTVGAPLSFLDHHLKVGNSLVGTRVEEVRRALEAEGAQFDVFGGPFAGLLRATELMRGVATRTDATFAEVAESTAEYAEFEDRMRPYKRVLDLWVSRWFGNDGAEELLRSHGTEVLDAFRAHATPLREEQQLTLEDAALLEDRFGFFHWELEFPEVFVDLDHARWKENPGFDAVIGNPPYVRQEDLAPFKPFFKEAFPTVYHGTADLFVYFFAQGLELAQYDGRLSYISSNSWIRANYAGALRTVLRTEVTVESIVDLGDNRVFADAPDVYPAILTVRRASPPGDYTAQVATFTRGEGIGDFREKVAGKLVPVTIHNQNDSGWQLGDEASRQLFTKLMASGWPLGEVVEGRIYYGIKTGLNKAFIIDQQTRDRLVRADASSAEIIKPILQGQDLRPWYQEDEGRWLVLFPTGWTCEAFGGGLSEADAWARLRTRHGAVAEYLEPFANAARKRHDKGEYWWELRSCDYYDAFEQPKIIWPDIAKRPRFSWDTSGAYLLNTGYAALPGDPWILGYLASRCAWFLISRIAVSFGERAGANRYRLIDQYMRPLPIPTAPAAEREAIGALAMAITEQARDRYTLHRRARHRIASDLGTTGTKLNRKLTEWWTLDFGAFRAEVKKALKHDIPLRERDEWEAWLGEQRAAHERHTGGIVRLETELNERVYRLFELDPAEIRIIEDSTKYGYGEV